MDRCFDVCLSFASCEGDGFGKGELVAIDHEGIRFLSHFLNVFLMHFPARFQGGFGTPSGSLLGAILGHFLALKIDGVLDLFSEPFWDDSRGQNGYPNPLKK